MARLRAKWLEDNILRYEVSSQTADFTAANGFLYLVNPAAATVNVTLPAPAAGTHIWIKDMSGDLSAKTINIVRNGLENIDGQASNIQVESEYETVKLFCDGTDWYRV